MTIFLQHISFPVAILISLLSWLLGIPVDYRGLATFKNHFFHTFNSLSCLLCLYFSDHEWKSKHILLPFRYGVAYAIMQFVLQNAGEYSHLIGWHNLNLASDWFLLNIILSSDWLTQYNSCFWLVYTIIIICSDWLTQYNTLSWLVDILKYILEFYWLFFQVNQSCIPSSTIKRIWR